METPTQAPIHATSEYREPATEPAAPQQRRLCAVMRRWRITSERTQQEVAKDIGTSAQALGRFEKGEEVSGETLALLLTWLLQKAQ